MAYVEDPVSALLLMLIFLETAIIFGQWINYRANSVIIDQKPTLRQLMIPLGNFIIKISIFTIISIVIIVIMFPDSYTNASIGILAGYISGVMVLIYQKEFHMF
jgi:hypothetical protein